MQTFKEGHTPKCPGCGCTDFVVTEAENVENADKKLAFLMCAAEQCQRLISVLPGSAVWHIRD